MQIGGEKIAREYRVIKLERLNTKPLELKVHSIPLGFNRLFNSICPYPQPPVKVVVKNGVEHREENLYDKKYLDDVAERSDLRTYFTLFHALKDDTNIKFSLSDITSIEQLISFRKEIQDSGLGDGEIIKIYTAAIEAGGVTTADIEKAKVGF